MWWRLALVNAGLLAASFEPMHAPIKWIQSRTGKFVLSPISNSPLASALPQKLTVADLPESMYPSRIPHFTAKPDQTIIWDATGWCIEAAGNADGAEVRINRCTSGPTQLWDCLPQTKQIRLKGTSSCLHVKNEADLNGAQIELRTCDGIASWEFSDSEPVLENTSLSYTRHALIVFLSVTALGLSLGAWWWMQLAKQPHTIASIPSDMDQGGVSLSAPLAGHQGSRSSILSLDLGKQNMVPSVMTLNPSQVKQSMAPASATLKKIPHFENPRTFGLTPILVDETPLPVDIADEDDDDDDDVDCGSSAIVDPPGTKVVAAPGEVGLFTEGQDLAELFDVLLAPPSLGVLDPSTIRWAGHTKRRGEVHRDGDWHRAVHLWVVVRRGEELDVLMQKRALTKDTFPGCWDVSAAGHIGAGGDPLETVMREAEEELGLNVSPESLKHMFTIAVENTGTTQKHGTFIDREVDYVYMYEIANGEVNNLRFATGEVEGLRLQPLPSLLCQLRDRDEAFVLRDERYQNALRRGVRAKR